MIALAFPVGQDYIAYQTTSCLSVTVTDWAQKRNAPAVNRSVSARPGCIRACAGIPRQFTPTHSNSPSRATWTIGRAVMRALTPLPSNRRSEAQTCSDTSTGTSAGAAGEHPATLLRRFEPVASR